MADKILVSLSFFIYCFFEDICSKHDRLIACFHAVFVVKGLKVIKVSIDKYLQKAKGEIVENSQQARSEHLGRAVMNLDYLYKISLDKTTEGNGKVVTDPLPAIRVCLDIQKEKNRLLQLSRVYDPRGPKDVPEELLPDEVHKLLDDVKIVNVPPPREIDLDAEFGKNLIAGSSG